MLHEYLAVADVGRAEHVLALGCGTGVEVRELIRRPDFHGKVTAIDISAELINRAKAFAAQEGRGERVEWLVDDAQSLNLTTASFDLVIAHTLVSHVPHPKKILQEATRVVRPGGTVIIFDGDYATLTFGPDSEMDERIITALITNPRVTRAMSQLLRDFGLELADSRGWVLTEIGRADFFLAALQSFFVLVPKTGVATPEEVEAFVASQREANEKNTFFAG